MRVLLDRLPTEHRTLVQSYAAQHLIHWPLALRQAHPFERFSHPPSWWPLVRLVRFHPPRPQTWLFQTNDLDHVEALDLKGCREGIFDLVRDARVWTGRPKALSLSWTDLQNHGAQALTQL
ncbi:MAG: hypothetical protein AAFS10_22480, partial [Myxococcota bacterium]